MSVYGYFEGSIEEEDGKHFSTALYEKDPKAVLVSDAVTDKRLAHPNRQKLLNRVGKGDTIIFPSILHLSRRLNECIDNYLSLLGQRVELIFVEDPVIDSAVYRLCFRFPQDTEGENEEEDAPLPEIPGEALPIVMVLAQEQLTRVFSQKKKDTGHHSECTREGIAKAKKLGKHMGQRVGGNRMTPQKRKTREVIEKENKSFGGTLSDSECIALAGVSESTYYRHKKALLDEQKEVAEDIPESVRK